ncbi:MAG: hypothetical protein K2Y27_01225 [Xanthobacteraceae bacterium]|nr:hypothetical protein [Xanthobacteraceae bacterium]
MAWDSQDALAEIARLVTPGMLGFYTHLEITEVFATPRGGHELNVFTLIVAEERKSVPPKQPTYLSPKPIRLKACKGWIFGIERSYRPIADLVPILSTLDGQQGWKVAAEAVQIGHLTPLPPQFAPPDSSREIPINAVLKNNFWSGSHILEWVDTKKAGVMPFLQPEVLRELSSAVYSCVPLRLAAVSDRLGNIVLQLPVTIILAKFDQRRASGDFVVDLQWHPQATPRPLRASCAVEFDAALERYASRPINGPQTALPMRPHEGLHQGLIWDDQNQLILAATGERGSINTVNWDTQPIHPEPRVFTIRDKHGNENEVRIQLRSSIRSTIGQPSAAHEWTRRRIYRDEAERLKAQRRFVQYRSDPGQHDFGHAKALKALRDLIAEYGADGAWLWDPYLEAADVLNTLFHCPHAGADLRALTMGKEARVQNAAIPLAGLSGLRQCICSLFRRRSASPALSFAQRQRAVLQSTASNFQGLRLEYRIKTGQAGWGFHDRFLIFPRTGRGALAWSLGTSVNSVGKDHHILQQVDDGQLVMDAFEELWNELNRPDHLIWKVP